MVSRWLLGATVGIALTVSACDSELRRVRSGDTLQPGEEVSFMFITHRGARILGHFNGRWWRATEALKLTGSAAASWYPRGWERSSDDPGQKRVVLRYDSDRQRIVASWKDTAVTYEPGPELDQSEFCA